MERLPKIAIMYDFDKTLGTQDMQEFTFIPNLGQSPEAFWREANRYSEMLGMDRVLAYMYVMLDKAKANKQPIRRQDFVGLGAAIEYFPGVAAWFSWISRFGQSRGVEVEHYIISSGLREIIEGTEIFENFREVFACEFYYDENGVAVWPKNVVNYTTKTQFLFRINKGILDISNDDDLNRYTPESERPIPFRNMIYIGDGYTDVPAMKLVKTSGGYSIAVHKPGEKARARELLTHGRVNFLMEADYREGSELAQTVQAIIQKMAVESRLVAASEAQVDGE